MSATILVFLFMNHQVQYGALTDDGVPTAIYADAHDVAAQDAKDDINITPVTPNHNPPAQILTASEFSIMLDKIIPISSAGKVRVCAVTPTIAFTSDLRNQLFDRMGKIDDAAHGNFDIWEDAVTLKKTMKLDASYPVTFATAFAYCKASAF